MHLDVEVLRDFYYRSSLGRAAQRSLRDRMQTLWPDAERQVVLGYGFAVPLLRPYLSRAQRVIGVMPAQQGVMAWPLGMGNISLLSDETLWPVATDTVDKLVMLHGLETSDRPDAVLDEAARVLAPEGRLLLILPNRRGLWARQEGTPFAYGRPYTRSQVERQLEHHGFVPGRHAGALFFPPSERRFWLRSAPLIDRIGSGLSNDRAGGALMVEAVRRDPPPPRGLRATMRRPLQVLDGVAVPGVRPV